MTGRRAVPYELSGREANDASDLIRLRAEIVTPAPVRLRRKIDPDDLPVLGTAIAGQCDCIVTGDKDLLRLSCVGEIPILAPADFWEWEARRQK